MYSERYSLRGRQAHGRRRARRRASAREALFTSDVNGSGKGLKYVLLRYFLSFFSRTESSGAKEGSVAGSTTLRAQRTTQIAASSKVVVDE